MSDYAPHQVIGIIRLRSVDFEREFGQHLCWRGAVREAQTTVEGRIVTFERQDQANPKPGYLLVLVGAWLGGFVGLLVAFWIIASMELSGFDLLGAALYAQLLAVPLGAVIGIGAALALFKRSAPVVTVLLSIPVWLVIFGALYGMVLIGSDLSRFIDSYSPAILFFIPPLVVPLVSRWMALAASRRRNNSTTSSV